MKQSGIYPRVYLYRRIVQAKLFMDTHYNEKIVLDDIADEASFSRFHFMRLFKTSYGKTPHQYLSYVRIEKAKEFLKNGFSVNDVCSLVGFDSPTSFAGLFKRLSGLSPSAYQAEQKKLMLDISQRPLHYIPGCFSEMKGWKKSNFEEPA